jgi:hypothetical protein
MADLCLIHASEDKETASVLVALLRTHWDVWWDGDIPQGEWDDRVLAAIEQSKGVVALITKASEQKPILKDELRYAYKKKIPIFPFVIEQAEMPLGLGALDRTDAFNWKAEENHDGFKELVQKIGKQLDDVALKRKKSLIINGKDIRLPVFMYSLSSFETQISPKDGLQLFSVLKQPRAILISAYDAWNHQKDKKFLSMIKTVSRSGCAVFLDSGNYESDRKNDRKTKNNPDGWDPSKFIEIAKKISPDAAFGFDNPRPKEDKDKTVNRIVKETLRDQKELGQVNFPIFPIVHVPKNRMGVNQAGFAPELVCKIVEELDPVMIAIPERELGDGITERIKTVRNIRLSLNKLGKYYPLHLLGAGNILSVIALAVAGADSFDGLEWCRTAGEWDSATLHHFHQFDFFAADYVGRIVDPSIRHLVENPSTAFPARVACMNIEIYNYWITLLQDIIFSGQVEPWIQSVLPRKGRHICEALKG